MYQGNPSSNPKSNNSQMQNMQNTAAVDANQSYAGLQNLLNLINQQQIRLPTPQIAGFPITSPSVLQQPQYLNLLRQHQQLQQQSQQQQPQRQTQNPAAQQQQQPSPQQATANSARILSMLPNLQYIDNQVM